MFIKVKVPPQNIVTPNVFTSQEFIALSDISILNGATESDLKQSLNISSGIANSHYSDDNDDQDNTNAQATTKNAISKKESFDSSLSLNFSSSQQSLNNGEIETINFDNKRPTESTDSAKNENSNNMPKKKKFKKTVKSSLNNSSNLNINKIIEQMNQIKEADSNFDSIDQVKNENVADFELIPLPCKEKTSIESNPIVLYPVNCNTISEPKLDVTLMNPTPTIVKLTNDEPVVKLNPQHVERIENEVPEKKNCDIVKSFECIGKFLFVLKVLKN